MQHNLGSIEQIPFGEGREFTIEGEEIVVFRLRSGNVYATQALCPHHGAPLRDGLTGGTTLICPFHAWKFDVSSGAVILGNCDLKTYPVTVSDEGSIHITLNGEADIS